MPLLYWALLDIQQSAIADGFTIVTTTDVACHHWLRHTLREPQKHAKPVLRRGLLMQWDARFCFVAFEDLEQDEAGNTFTHTFTWHGWEECQTRYFYFWATWHGEKMKSTSPIFSKHFVAPTEPQLQEEHSAPLDGKRGMDDGSEIAQSFTPRANYSVSKLWVPLWKTEPEYDGTIYIQIRTNDVNHPSETVLWQTTISALSLPAAPYIWFTFPVDGVSAQTGVPLWIVERWEHAVYWFWVPYSMADSGDLYPRGESLSRPVDGEWSGYDTGIDLGFKIFGI